MTERVKYEVKLDLDGHWQEKIFWAQIGLGPWELESWTFRVGHLIS